MKKVWKGKKVSVCRPSWLRFDIYVLTLYIYSYPTDIFLPLARQQSCRLRPRKTYLTLPLPLPCPTLLKACRKSPMTHEMTYNDINDTKWHEMTWNETTWQKMTWHEMTWNDMKWHEWCEMTWMTWNVMNDIKCDEWHEMTWNGMKWHDMTWNDINDLNNMKLHEIA
jgi:hypothetical protein